MEKLENDVLSDENVPKPILWRRYVDDTFCLWDQSDDDLNLFLSKLNNYHKDIKFTVEKECNKSLPFLDVMCKRNVSNIETSVYRKPTSTFRLLDANSNHSWAQREGVIKTLTNRALNVCSSEDSKKEELNLLRKIFKSNGYSPYTIKKAMNSVITKRTASSVEDLQFE